MKIHSLSGKISVLMAGCVAVFIIAVYFIISLTVESVINQNIEDEVRAKALVLSEELQNRQQRALNASELLTRSPGLLEAIRTGNRQGALAIGQQALKTLELDFLVVTDQEGKVFVRTHEPEKYGDSIIDQVNIQRALQGEASVGIEEGTSVNYSIRAGAPLQDEEGRIYGAVSLGYALSENDYVDAQKKIFNCDVTVFLGDERIATTIMGKNGTRLVGTKMEDQRIIDTVLKQGKAYYGSTTINGAKYFVGYTPLADVTGKVSGMLFLGQSYNVAAMLSQKLIRNQAVFMAVLGVFMGFCVVFMFRITILRRIKTITAMLKDIAEGEGDLTKRVAVSAQDEIGEMSAYFNLFIENIHEVVKGIIAETNKVNTAILASHRNIAVLTGELENTAATVQELSAGMEETASSTEEITATSTEIASAVEVVAIKAQEGALSAHEISSKAVSLKDNAFELQAEADQTRSAIKQTMDAALAKTTEVAKIKSLSEVILQIAVQTNLLALNAAIESARAGEAGKGFSVVSEEIRKLAENSQNTVKEIQDTLGVIFEVVENLADTSRQMLEYIDTKVVENYKESVLVGENYDHDAQTIDGWAAELSATSQELLASIKTVADGIAEIARSTEFGSQGTAHVAAQVAMLKDKANEIKTETDSVKGSADNLQALVRKFKI
ncbi:methyl-accepting chemotaxis protein [Desulfitobacterium hafniense]|uniref:methyl-accepting chemotaxis protein n=1 Tax=Desulfitobacterium hafniense TaxID=49338 RepID=UPI0003676332|nr:methyl-accepting chemotaxis protein [Desulfitobacterium hafniense]